MIQDEDVVLLFNKETLLCICGYMYVLFYLGVQCKKFRSSRLASDQLAFSFQCILNFLRIFYATQPDVGQFLQLHLSGSLGDSYWP